MPTNYEVERRSIAPLSRLGIDSQDTLERYAAQTRWPHLFSKEKMFSLAGSLKGKKILEVGW